MNFLSLSISDIIQILVADRAAIKSRQDDDHLCIFVRSYSARSLNWELDCLRVNDPGIVKRSSSTTMRSIVLVRCHLLGTLLEVSSKQDWQTRWLAAGEMASGAIGSWMTSAGSKTAR